MSDMHLPVSQAMRRLNQLLRQLSRRPEDVVYITRNGEPWMVMVSPDYYRDCLGLIENETALVEQYTPRPESPGDGSNEQGRE